MLLKPLILEMANPQKSFFLFGRPSTKLAQQNAPERRNHLSALIYVRGVGEIPEMHENQNQGEKRREK